MDPDAADVTEVADSLSPTTPGIVAMTVAILVGVVFSYIVYS